MFLVRCLRLKVLGKFKYWGRVMNKLDGEWLGQYSNLEKLRRFWGRFVKSMGREESYVLTYDMFLRVVVHTIILYG